MSSRLKDRSETFNFIVLIYYKIYFILDLFKNEHIVIVLIESSIPSRRNKDTKNDG